MTPKRIDVKSDEKIAEKFWDAWQRHFGEEIAKNPIVIEKAQDTQKPA